MTIAKEFAAKFLVASVALAMVFMAAAPAKAQTTEELQKMINDLLAQVAALQSQTGQGGTSVASGICPYTWTRDLSSGATGADVMKLQQFLNADADTRVAASGAGSVGAETEYYGPATAAAVSKLQVKYRSEILSPVNLVNPTGYFGPGTRAKANALCVASTDTTDEDTTDEDTDEDEDEDADDEDVTLRGEAALQDASLDDASDDTVEEGSEDAEVAELTVEFEDGDAEISRIDVSFDTSGISATTDPWDIFETVSLWVDGDKVAEENADSDRDYLSDDMTIRFSGLDLVAMEDEEVEIVIAATIQGSIDSTDMGAVVITVESLRYFDADGVASTENDPATPDTASVTIEEAGTDDELIVKTSSNDPDGTTLQVEDDSKSDWYNVFTFDLDTDDSVNDIELTTVVVTVNTTVAGYSTLVDDAEIVIDGVTVDDFTTVLSTTTIAGDTAVLTFDVDGDVVIDAGDRVEAELMLRFKSLAPANEGATVMAQVTALNADAFVAEGADDLSPTTPDQIRGAATGDAHTLRTAGVDVSSDTVSAVVTNGDAAGDDYATFKIALEVTAFEQDVYISTNVASSVAYAIEDAAGTPVSGTTSVVVESTGDETSGAFEITEGSTETITITVTFDATSAGATARLNLNTLTFAASAAAATNASTADDQSWTASPDEDYRTAVVTLVN